LSQSLFGDKTLANRKRALELQEQVYFGRLGQIRDWHKKVLAQAEQGYVRSVTGRYLSLYGRPDDNAKAAAAFHGQGTSADHVQAVMIRYKREKNVVANLQVHDSLVFSVPKTWDDTKVKEFIGLMQEPTWRLPGFMAPGKIKRGSTYGSMKAI
jgi:DNA polymerase I-like protein with 3'-5' exonuclease and polymerase domains